MLKKTKQKPKQNRKKKKQTQKNLQAKIPPSTITHIFPAFGSLADKYVL